MKIRLTLFVLLLLPFITPAQELRYRVLDLKTKEPIPFATIKFGTGNNGTVAGLDGTFIIPNTTVTAIDVSSVGYETKHVQLFRGPVDIYLRMTDHALNEFAVTPPYDKIRRIINSAIANKNANNPDKYDTYRCNVYYKMVVDFTVPDSLISDTSKDSREARDFMENQHLLMSETYSVRTWSKPQRLQEDVIASRFSGFKKSMFTSLVTDVLPFHAYNDYITLNGRDYHNPVSAGFERFYKFNLTDELLQGNDTVWILSFSPRGNNANQLRGKVYINSDGFAISHILAQGSDTTLLMKARIEQEYERVPTEEGSRRWFPRHLNYIIDWQYKVDGTFVGYHMKGNSRIDSVTWQEKDDFRYDRAHTVRLAKNADELSDSAWNSIRPEPLDSKALRTYHVIDSIGARWKLDNKMNYLSKLPEGKIPLSFLDLDLRRLITANRVENVRLGLGLQTNERLIKWLSVGGWAGYGFRDAAWKYGAFAEIYADKYKEFVIRGGFSDDIISPGRVRLDRDLDKGYLNMYLLQRADNIRTTYGLVRKRFGYLALELEGRQQQIIPKYTYALQYPAESFSRFTATEASLSFRYAYAERTAPFFGYYSRTGSRYPIWYGKVTYGMLESGHTMQTPYIQALTAVVWHKHINRLGFEHILLEGGKSWSNDPLPLSKLFAGNGFKYDSRGSFQSSAYTFGGMMTIYPYEYYMDQFVNFIYRHDFDWKLYKLGSSKSSLSSAPNISLQYNMLYGTMEHPEVHKGVAFGVPDTAYHEAGLLLNNLLRLRYLSLYYLTINVGYFYHVTDGEFDSKKNGRLVTGLGIEF